jgi:hypothetical protein
MTREQAKKLYLRLYGSTPLPIPQAVSDAVLTRAGHRCEECGSRPVELHHLTYDECHGQFYPDEYPIFGKETPRDLVVLCPGMSSRGAHWPIWRVLRRSRGMCGRAELL